MLRKRTELLSIKDGRYYYEGIPFSGVSFEHGAARSVNAVLMDKGDVVSAYKSPYFPAPEYLAQIDITGFTEDCVANDEDANLGNGDDLEYVLSEGYFDLFVQGVAYSGVAFEFRGGTCFSEFGYKTGRLVSRADWDVAGNLRRLYLAGDITQYYQWYSPGKLESAHVVRHGRTSKGAATYLLNGDFRFYEDGSIAVLSMDKAFLSFLDKYPSKILYRPIDKIAGIGSFRGGKALTLSGDGIDDEAFNTMYRDGVFDMTSELNMYETLVSDDNGNLEALFKNRIKKLKVYSNRNFGPDFLNKVRHSRPDIQIETRSY